MAKDFYEGAAAPKVRSFSDKENRCRRVFEWTVNKYGAVWHLCTPGDGQSIIFRRQEDYAFAMTLVAMCAYDCHEVQIITFELMSNHVHFVMCGERDQVLAFFGLFRKRLLRYYSSLDVTVNLAKFNCGEPILINSLESLRNQICYTNRNNFVIDPDQTPFSYRYGANSYFFMPFVKQLKDCVFDELTERAKRVLLHSKNLEYPGNYIVIDGYLSPVNYCRFDIGEGVFRDARHYYNKLSKGVESYKEVASLLGDSIYYTDDELSDIIYRICRERFDGQRPSLLGKDAKLELARTLHFDYNADNGKIARLLGLSKVIIDQLFPLRK